MERLGVDVVIGGHDHNYERTHPIKDFNTDPAYPGIVHLVTGGGGSGLKPVNPEPFSAASAVAHHYLKLTIDGDQLRGQAIDLGGQVPDSFTLQNQIAP